ncbi:MAG TPA: DUF192 domain-containing protein [Thermoanaerobaculia bacterium]|nr:DUF192 domain-containing protein [Thermoanaerobaculia bacterium]
MKSERMVAALALLLAFCTKPEAPAPRAQPEPQPQAAAPVSTSPASRVILPDGYAVRVELAADNETRAQGLMFRDRLPEGTGMIFLFTETGDYPFWMKNTLIPLDMIWIDEARRIAAIHHDVPPCKADPCPSYPPNAPARYVLELAGGEAKKHNLAVGQQLTFEGLEHVVVR